MLGKWIAKPSLERRTPITQIKSSRPLVLAWKALFLVGVWFYLRDWGSPFAWRLCDSFSKYVAFDLVTHVPFMFLSCSLADHYPTTDDHYPTTDDHRRPLYDHYTTTIRPLTTIISSLYEVIKGPCIGHIKLLGSGVVLKGCPKGMAIYK